MTDDPDRRRSLVYTSPYTPDGMIDPATPSRSQHIDIPDDFQYESLEQALDAYYLLLEASQNDSSGIDYQVLYEDSVSEAAESNGEPFYDYDVGQHLHELQECFRDALRPFSQEEVLVYRDHVIRGTPIYEAAATHGITPSQAHHVVQTMSQRIRVRLIEADMMIDPHEGESDVLHFHSLGGQGGHNE